MSESTSCVRIKASYQWARSATVDTTPPDPCPTNPAHVLLTTHVWSIPSGVNSRWSSTSLSGCAVTVSIANAANR